MSYVVDLRVWMDVGGLCRVGGMHACMHGASNLIDYLAFFLLLPFVNIMVK